jgi:ribose-phosphate pyrophosphokinase
MKPLIFTMPGNEGAGKKLIDKCNAEAGDLVVRKFPDGESYIRVAGNVKGRKVIVVSTLHKPDEKILPLMFLCRQLKEMKAETVVLVAPYLSYMRQDKAFIPGESVTSIYFAELLSSFADKLITVDPHLHRRETMNEIYPISCDVIKSAALISEWISENVKDPLLIGPDSESKQWVSDVAKKASAPFIVLEKTRSGDRDVKVTVPEVEKYKGHTPVLVDDIISTARTMIETIGHLKAAGMKPAVCIGVHAVFADNAYYDLQDAGAEKIITCNTIEHVSNGIDVTELIAESILK